MTSQQVERFVEAYSALTGVDLDKFSVFKALEEMGKDTQLRSAGYIQKLEFTKARSTDPCLQPGQYK